MRKKYMYMAIAVILGLSSTTLLTTACANNVAQTEPTVDQTLDKSDDNLIMLDGPDSVTEVEKNKEDIYWNEQAAYAGESVIHSGSAILYYSKAAVKKNKTVCVNAGHGTSGGGEHYTYCHPDHTPKATSGSTASGALKATSVSYGTTLLDGMSEAQANLEMAWEVKDKLLGAGYNVLMIRDGYDVQLDNIARTVLANQYADCHVSLHYDSTEYDKGAFVINVPEIEEYIRMEPVASHWQEHNRLGDCIISGMKSAGVKIFGDGSMGIDLTQTSYSTIPSIDVEVGDRGSDYSYVTRQQIADGILAGVDMFLGK